MICGIVPSEWMSELCLCLHDRVVHIVTLIPSVVCMLFDFAKVPPKPITVNQT